MLKDAGRRYRACLLFAFVLGWSSTLLSNVLSVAAWVPSNSCCGGSPRHFPPFRMAPADSEILATDGNRIRRKIRLDSGQDAIVLSRTVPIIDDWSITVWEWEKPAAVIESYWEAQSRNAALVHDSRLLDPFGIVSWPGSVVAAQEMQCRQSMLKDKNVLILGAGVGMEAQAAAMTGAKHVLATDIHPTTLKQLEFGAKEANIESSIIETRILDLFSQQPLPKADVLIAADILYNEQLASQVARRCAEAVVSNPEIKILVTDSQRFVDFVTELNENLKEVQKDGYRPLQWEERNLDQFTGSGVAIDEDQTYDVKVRVLWIGL
jgi:predicted nicotinamide N-methyase